MKPNVSVRSNVYIRADCDLRTDRQFIAQVRGRSALTRLIAVLEPGTEPRAAAQRHLSETQLSQVAWQARCAHCGALPEGPVAGPLGIEVVFRCPRAECSIPSRIARSVAVDVTLIRTAAERFAKPVSDIVEEALVDADATVDEPPAARDVVRVPITVRLTLSQHHFMSDASIERALRRYLSRRH